MKMCRMIREEIGKERKSYIILILMCIFTFTVGKELNIADAAHLTVWEFVLLNLTNHYYLIYGLFLIFLYWSFGNIRSCRDLEKVRYQSIRKYYRYHNYGVVLKLAVLIGAHIFIAFFVAIKKLPFDNTFTGQTIPGYYHDTLEFVLLFKQYFASPMEAVAVVSLYLLVGLFTIYNLLFFANEWKGKKATIVSVALIILSVMLGFRTSLDEGILGIFFANNYFILHHVLFVGKSSLAIVKVFLFVLFMVGVVYLLYKCVNPFGFVNMRRKIQRCHAISESVCGIPKMLLFLAGLYGIMLVPISVSRGSVGEYVFSLLCGYSNVEFRLIEFLYYIMFFVFPLFIIGSMRENEKKGKNQLFQFRCESRKNWRRMNQTQYFIFLAKYAFFYIVIGCVIVGVWCLVGAGDSTNFWQEIEMAYGVGKETIQYMMLLALCIKIVELFVLFLVNTIWSRYLPSSIMAFLLTFAGYAIPIVLKTSGGSSLYQILECINQMEGML